MKGDFIAHKPDELNPLLQTENDQKTMLKKGAVVIDVCAMGVVKLIKEFYL